MKSNKRQEVLQAVRRNAALLRRDLRRAHFEDLRHPRLMARGYAILAILDAFGAVVPTAYGTSPTLEA